MLNPASGGRQRGAVRRVLLDGLSSDRRDPAIPIRVRRELSDLSDRLLGPLLFAMFLFYLLFLLCFPFCYVFLFFRAVLQKGQAKQRRVFQQKLAGAIGQE